MIRDLVVRAGAAVLPWWARWAMLAALVLSAYGMGRLQEARRGADAFAQYVGAEAAASSKIAGALANVVTRTEVVYRDRIHNIYTQGETIEAYIPKYIPIDADRMFAVPVGFVRLYNAAWSGEPAGPAADSDREPSGVPFSAVAAAEANNATSCRAWREQALGWRTFYAGQQVAVNGRAGGWAATIADPPGD